jgi:hypothetical protein
MSAKAFATLAALIFTIVAIAQLARAALAVPVTIGGGELPILASWIAGGLLVVMAFLGYTARSG